jgi:predicted nucleotidyltransferase component of viral defense system
LDAAMNDAVKTMLDKYHCVSEQDYINALKEIFQEIALLGLWRAKFFEQAAFYGGTALRVLYGLDRYSEDIDFTLLNPQKDFSLDKYNEAVMSEIKAFGFDVTVKTKSKSVGSAIESAFIKANTMQQILTINLPEEIAKKIHNMNTLKIKMEVDTDPPGKFSTEVKCLFLPIPFSVLTMVREDLFAGKVHALLCRKWRNRIKGRDWYDFYWYVSRDVPVNLIHLEQRMIQSGHWKPGDKLTHAKLLGLILDKIDSISFEQAKKDVITFLKEKASIDLWSKSFFVALTSKLKSVRPLDRSY